MAQSINCNQSTFKPFLSDSQNGNSVSSTSTNTTTSQFPSKGFLFSSTISSTTDQTDTDSDMKFTNDNLSSNLNSMNLPRPPYSNRRRPISTSKNNNNNKPNYNCNSNYFNSNSTSMSDNRCNHESRNASSKRRSSIYHTSYIHWDEAKFKHKSQKPQINIKKAIDLSSVWNSNISKMSYDIEIQQLVTRNHSSLNKLWQHNPVSLLKLNSVPL